MNKFQTRCRCRLTCLCNRMDSVDIDDFQVSCLDNWNIVNIVSQDEESYKQSRIWRVRVKHKSVWYSLGLNCQIDVRYVCMEMRRQPWPGNIHYDVFSLNR